MTLLSALGGGLFIIPLGLFLGSAYSFYRAYIQWQSGSAGYQKVDGVDKWVESKEKVSLTSIGAFWFGAILLFCSVGSLIWMISEK